MPSFQPNIAIVALERVLEILMHYGRLAKERHLQKLISKHLCARLNYYPSRSRGRKSCLYLSFVFVFCCFGHLDKQTNSLTLIISIPQAFVAIATSSGGIQTSVSFLASLSCTFNPFQQWPSYPGV